MRRAQLILLGLLFVLSWITYLDRAAISTAKPMIAGDLDLSDEAMGLVFGAFALGYALAQVPSGWFADRVGPRLALAAVVTAWSICTSLTGAARSLPAMVAVRFLFGVTEAGAYPGSARAFYSWLPTGEHGRANGVIFSGARLGAAFSFPVLAWLIGGFGWRTAFLLLGLPGVVWGVVWLAWFRDQPPYPAPKPASGGEDVRLGDVFRSRPMLLAMAQYFASNFTFFICLSWMHPYLMSHYRLSRETAAWYSMIVLLIGATAQWAAGFLVDRLYESRYRAHSRRIPAMIGFLLSAAGLALLRLSATPGGGVACFALATFGAEMTVSPSWAFCIDLGRKKSGSVSGAMNMIGNLGSFVSASIFPVMYRLTGDGMAYFLTAAALNVTAAAAWLLMKADRQNLGTVD